MIDSKGDIAVVVTSDGRPENYTYLANSHHGICWVRLFAMTLAKLVLIFSILSGSMFAQTVSDKSPVQDRRGFIRADSMKCDGKSDDTAAFNALIASAVSDTGPAAAPVELQTLQLPGGKCRFASAPKPIPAGIKILGIANRNGTWLIADYNEPVPENGFLTWNASFRESGSGIGGGLEHVHISKGSAKIGGTALKVTGQDDAHRSGFILFNDIYINSAFGAPGYWHHHLVADGTCCTTSGSNGVRDVMLTNFHFAQSRPPREAESILIINAVHVHIVNGVIFSSQAGGIKIMGLSAGHNELSDDVLISNVQVEGTLILDGVEGLVFSGWLAGRLFTTPSSTRCYISGIIEGAIDNKAHCAISADQVTSVPNLLSAEDTDNAGQIRLVGGVASYQFKHKLSVVPICTASDTDSPAAVQVTVRQSELILHGKGDDTISYVCLARE
jgi:hypothetical protein